MVATKTPPAKVTGLDTVAREYTRQVDLTPTVIADRCAAIDQEMERVRTTTDKLTTGQFLPVECAKEQLEAARDARLSELAAQKAELQSALTHAPLDAKYKRIDLSFMRTIRRMSRKHGIALPAYVMYSIDDPTCRLEVTCTQGSRYDGQAYLNKNVSPAILSGFWADIIERLAVRAKQLYEKPRVISVAMGLESGFGSNKIPESVRTKIVEAQPLFDKIYLLTEAPDWDYQLKVSKVPLSVVIRRSLLRMLDPLVIGEKDGYFWQIDLFDLTRAEDYLREFTYKL